MLMLYHDADVVPFMNNECTFRTTGNDMRLQKVRFKYDLCKYCFTNRVVNIIVCLTGLLQLTVLIYLKQDLIHSGIIRIL